MADPTKTPFNLVITTSATAYAGEKVKIHNTTRAVAPIEATLDSDGMCIVNPKDSNTSWAANDGFRVEMNGRLQGYVTGTLKEKGQKVQITVAANTTSPAVDL